MEQLWAQGQRLTLGGSWMAGIHLTPRKQRKTKSPTVTHSYHQVLYVYHSHDGRNPMKKLAHRWHPLLPLFAPLNALSLIALGKNLTTVYILLFRKVHPYIHTQTMKKMWNQWRRRITGDMHTIFPPLCQLWPGTTLGIGRYPLNTTRKTRVLEGTRSCDSPSQTTFLPLRASVSF